MISIMALLLLTFMSMHASLHPFIYAIVLKVVFGMVF